MSAFRRPVTPGAGFFEGLEGGADPAVLVEAADRAAELLVRASPGPERTALAQRIASAGDGDGLALLAQLWSQSTPISLAGALWRLYLLRAFVVADPLRAAREFAAGLPLAEVSGAVAGVADPPGAEQVRALIDEVLLGVTTADFADVVLRAAAFAQVTSSGRAALGEEPAESAARLQELAHQLHRAGKHELADGLR